MKIIYENPLEIKGIPREPYNRGQRVFLKSTLTLYPGITVLVGCNGSGKTTLLKHIQDYLFKEYPKAFLITPRTKTMAEQVLMHFSSSGEVQSGDAWDLLGKIQFYIQAKGHEDTCIPKFPSTIQDILNRIRISDKVIVLGDDLDKGVSIDELRAFQISLRECVNKFKRSHPKIPLYVILTGNSFEMVCDNLCIDAKTMKVMQFLKYEEYASYVMHSRNLKNRREKVFQNLSENGKSKVRGKHTDVE